MGAFGALAPHAYSPDPILEPSTAPSLLLQLHFWPHRCVPEAPYNSWSFLPFSFCLRCPVDCPPDPFSFLMLSKLLLWLQNLHEIPSRGLLNFLQAISSCWHSTVLVLLFENLGLYLTPVSGRLLCKPLLNSP